MDFGYHCSVVYFQYVVENPRHFVLKMFHRSCFVWLKECLSLNDFCTPKSASIYRVNLFLDLLRFLRSPSRAAGDLSNLDAEGGVIRRLF